MKLFIKGLFVFVAALVLAIGVSVLPYRDFVANGGGQFGQLPENPSDELALSWLILLGSVATGIGLLAAGLLWNIRHWRTLVVAFAVTAVVNWSLFSVGMLDQAPGWLQYVMILTLPLGALWIVYGFVRGVLQSPIVRTFFRLIVATLFSATVTILFPVIVMIMALYLKSKGRANLTDTLKGASSLYEFMIMNIYPVFFSILPELMVVQARGRREKRQWKGKEPQMRSSLDFGKLRVGDVVLTGTDSWSMAAPIQASNILSSGEFDRHWCHAAIYKGDGEVIEAQSDGRGVTVTNVADWFFKRGSMLRVFRHRYLDEAELKGVVDYCQTKVDHKCAYDTWGVSFYALTSLMPPMLSGWLEGEFAEKIFNVKDSYFCSELVAEAFQTCGHDMFLRQPWRVKPLDFAYTPLLKEVECGYKRWEEKAAA